MADEKPELTAKIGREIGLDIPGVWATSLGVFHSEGIVSIVFAESMNAVNKDLGFEGNISRNAARVVIPLSTAKNLRDALNPIVNSSND